MPAEVTSADADARTRRWWETPAVRDPFFVGIVSFFVYALHGYQGALNRDLGVFTYGGEHVTKGVVPYVGIFNSVGPLADAVPGLAMWLGHFAGLDPIFASRLFFTGLSALACALLSVLARDTFGSRGAALVAPAVFLPFAEFLNLASSGPREKTTMVVFLIATLILIGRRRWLAAGVCTALATLTWQPVLAVALVAFVTAVALERKGRLRAAVIFVAGGLIPSLVSVVVFVLADALKMAVDGFVTVNAKYTHQPSALSAPRHTWTILWHSYNASLYLVILGLVASVVLALVSLPRVRPSLRDPSPEARLLVVTGLAGAVGTAWTVSVVNGGPDLFVLLPFAALGLTGCVVRVARAVPVRAGEVVTAAVVVASVALAVVTARVTSDDTLVRQRADVSAVLRTQPPRASVMSLDAPQVLAISRRTNPTSYQLFNSNMVRYLNHTYPGGMKGLAAEMRRLRPTFVVVGRSERGTWSHQLLSHDYWRVGRATNWTWYLSRTAGAAARQRATSANRRAMSPHPASAGRAAGAAVGIDLSRGSRHGRVPPRDRAPVP